MKIHIIWTTEKLNEMNVWIVRIILRLPKVLKAVLHLLPAQPALAKVTIDFEKAIWTVLRELLPDVEVQGCVFHWTQALWRKHYNIRENFLSLNEVAKV